MALLIGTLCGLVLTGSVCLTALGLYRRRWRGRRPVPAVVWLVTYTTGIGTVLATHGQSLPAATAEAALIAVAALPGLWWLGREHLPARRAPRPAPPARSEGCTVP
jgi:hypothetical protein